MKLIFARYGFFDKKKTLKEIGESLNISKERIRQKQAKAERKLKNYFNALNIKFKNIVW